VWRQAYAWSCSTGVKRDNQRNIDARGETKPGASRGGRLPLPAILLGLALVAIAIGALLLLTSRQSVSSQGGLSPTEALVTYTTETGNGGTEAVADAPLLVEVRFPRRSQSDEDALSVVLLELVDEQGVPAQFGGETPKPLDMKSAVDLTLWSYDGSVPSKPGTYHPRFTLKRLFGNLKPETLEVSSAILRVTAEPGTPVRSGYVYNKDEDLWILSPDASKRRRLTFLGLKSDDQYAAAPAWSPDGKRIAFTYLPKVASNEVPSTEIWSMAPDGTGMARLVAHGPDEALSAPYWSSDGTYLYFTVEVMASASANPETPQPMMGSSSWRIDRVEVATGTRTEWVRNALSPSTGGPGGDVVYLEEVPGAESSEAATEHRLVRAKPDGSERTVLLDNAPAFTVVGPRLSPDGKWVAYASVVNTSGSLTLSQARSFDFFRWLLFEPEVAEAHGLPWDLFMVPASGGGKPVRLTTLGDDEPHAVWVDSSTMTFMGVSGLFTLKIDAEGKPVGIPTKLGEGTRHAVLSWYSP
jgi:Tol biopolymer transport system component